jgi:hypothetical protein
MTTAPRPGARYWAAVESIWDAIDIYGNPVSFLRQIRAVKPMAGHLFAAHWCQSEVRNGGFHQFFGNPTGILAPEAVAGFAAIGIFEWAEILAEAMTFFGTPYPRERNKRMSMLPRGPGKRECWDPFYQLDERFYSWLRHDGDRWARVADQFAEAHQT